MENAEIHPFVLWAQLRKRFLGIFLFLFLVSAAAVGVSYWLPIRYQAKTTILPISATQQSSISGLLGQGGGVLGALTSSLLGGETTSSTMMAILLSQTLTRKVIEDLDLMPVLFSGVWDAETETWLPTKKGPPHIQMGIRKMLKKHIEIETDKKHRTIVISADFLEPETAAKVVNHYVKTLRHFLGTDTLTRATRNRKFVEESLSKKQAEYLQLSEALAEFSQRYRPNPNTNMVQIPWKELVGDAGVETPEVKKKLQALRKNAKVRQSNGKQMVELHQPVLFEYLNIRKEVLGRLNSMLASQFEVAKIEEARETLSFQVIDPGVPPVLRHSPNRVAICLLSFFGALLLVFMYLVMLVTFEASGHRRPNSSE